MNEAELLIEVKKAIGEYTNIRDDEYKTHITTVKFFMRGAGVPESVVNSSAAVGCVARGVLDVWDLGSGTGKFSEMFKMMVNQLANPE